MAKMAKKTNRWIVFMGTAFILSGCAQKERSFCTTDEDCLDCEVCIEGLCTLDDTSLNACGECGPVPEEICDDAKDNDCDGLTDEGCSELCRGIVCDQPPGPCHQEEGVCSNGVCTYQHKPEGTACSDGDACTSADECHRGACQGTPTRCAAPLPNECIDAFTMRSYDAEGTCVEGDCSYGFQDVNCQNGCAGGTCQGDPCAGVVCDQPPGPCYENSGVCSNGSCSYPPLADGTGCDDGQSCTVDDACQNGVCSGTPMTCNTPPQSECLDAGTMRTYETEGFCQDGSCSYNFQDVPCENGCAEGRCQGDPCAGVACDSPPNQCYLVPGTCADGECTYSYADGAGCSDGDACTIDDTCQNGTCAGAPLTCDNPPADECINSDTRRTYGAGSCDQGSCVYPHQDIHCENGCLNGECQACTPDCTGLECGPDPVCGESCGTCSTGEICDDDGQCIPAGCARDSYEPDGDPASASILEVDASQAHSICPAVDVDWWAFSIDSDSRITLETSGPSGDTRMWLYDDSLEELDYDDDGGAGTFSRILVNLSAGQYYVKVDEYGGSDEIDSYYILLTRHSVDLEWVTIPAGSFQMGSDSGDSDPDEQPVHPVSVPEHEMSRTEVTVGQYRACVDAAVCNDPSTESGCNWGETDREDHPVNCVSWHQAHGFCAWVGGRLPTEAEWESAARGGGRDITYPWGNTTASCTYAVMADGSGTSGCGLERTWPVCAKTEGHSDQGLCDMAGNVWEWVQDWYHPDYTGAPADGSAWEDPAGTKRVLRGGCHQSSEAWFLRCANRHRQPPSERPHCFGFRCAR